LADPCGRQVGQHFVAVGELVKGRPHRSAVDQGVVGVNHAFGVARGARSEEHGGHVVRLVDRHLFVDEVGVVAVKGVTGGGEFVDRGQARLVVMAQAAGVVKEQVFELWALLADLEHLVDLLLVFNHGKTHFGVVDGKDAFAAHCVLVKWHRNSAQ